RASRDQPRASARVTDPTLPGPHRIVRGRDAERGAGRGGGAHGEPGPRLRASQAGPRRGMAREGEGDCVMTDMWGDLVWGALADLNARLAPALPPPPPPPPPPP